MSSPSNFCPEYLDPWQYPTSPCRQQTWRPGEWRKRGQWSDVLHVNSKKKDWHPYQQPIDEVEPLVRYFSEPGNLVVDPCAGGFPTAVACKNLGRRCIAYDIDESYVIRGQDRRAGKTPGGGLTLP